MTDTIYRHTDFENGTLIALTTLRAKQVDVYAMITIEGQQHYLPPREAAKLAIWLLKANAYLDDDDKKQLIEIL